MRNIQKHMSAAGLQGQGIWATNAKSKEDS